MKLRVSEFRVWWDETNALSLLLLLLLHTSGGREREREARDGKECIWSLFVTFFAFFLSFFFLVASFLEAFFQNKKFCEILCRRFFLLFFLLQENAGSTKGWEEATIDEHRILCAFFSPPPLYTAATRYVFLLFWSYFRYWAAVSRCAVSFDAVKKFQSRFY